MSFVRHCQELAARDPSAIVFTYLVDGKAQEQSLTRGELEQRARAVAAELVTRGLGGQRVMLLYVPGLDFIVALLGCLYAGAIAVPAYPPDPVRLARTLPRLQAIMNDCVPSLVLTTTELLAMAPFAFSLAPDLASVPWASSEQWAEQDRAGAVLPAPRPTDLAFLQYTSGSTATPKGVMVSHDNLEVHLKQTDTCRKMEGAVTVSWLPFYHDLGLFGSILLPLWLGGRSILMSPLDFMKRPLGWLQAVDKYRAGISSAPPFALELCVRKVRPVDLTGLDLSCWRTLPVGAEPIPLDTLERFCKMLRPYGFQRNALVPGYGLAEAVLLVTGYGWADPWRSGSFSATALREGRVVPVPEGSADARALVSSGAVLPQQRIEIVDPVTARRCATDRVGEIWITGPSIPAGYWNRPADSAATFGARIADSAEGPFLRSGDLGFVVDGYLYVTSRIKDLVIIRGKNYHPQDIEETVIASHRLVRPGGCAAFSIDEGGGEQLVVAAEVSTRELPAGALRDGALLEISHAIRRAVSEQHELPVHTVALLEPGQLPKTSSGKISRQPARADFLSGQLGEVVRFTLTRLDEAAGSAEGLGAPASREYEDLVAWLSSALAQRLRIAPRDITPEMPFVALGIDSKDAVTITKELSTALGLSLPPTVLYECPNVAALAQKLSAVQPSPSAACLVRIASAEDGRPVFFIPGIFGVLSAFSYLWRELSAKLPLLGLSLPAHRGLPTPPSIEALAERYADEIVAIAGAAPFRLVGYCSGGMVALEVCRQLLLRGQSVEKLVLLDTPYLDVARTDLERLRQEAKLTAERHAKLTLEDAMRLVVHYMLGKQWILGEGEDLVEQMVKGGTANLTTFQGHAPRPIAVSTTLISAVERVALPLYDDDSQRNARRFADLLGESLSLLDTPGNHMSMMQPPHVGELARTLLTELGRGSARGEG
jgi:acyl-CoA synthetase (AMP-forming)/AMP-acid ligase II/thioesterase domain-containing protein/acyl carrier protein